MRQLQEAMTLKPPDQRTPPQQGTSNANKRARKPLIAPNGFMT